MAWITKLLVVANRTVDSDELYEMLVARAARGPIAVTLVAPATRESGDILTARTAAAERLQWAVARLREAGLTVDGVVGDEDPMCAVHEAWDPRYFDEVVVSTLPAGTSRWLAFDLPHRVRRYTDATVTHVVGRAREPVA